MEVTKGEFRKRSAKVIIWIFSCTIWGTTFCSDTGKKEKKKKASWDVFQKVGSEEAGTEDYFSKKSVICEGRKCSNFKPWYDQETF